MLQIELAHLCYWVKNLRLEQTISFMKIIEYRPGPQHCNADGMSRMEEGVLFN